MNILPEWHLKFSTDYWKYLKSIFKYSIFNLFIITYLSTLNIAYNFSYQKFTFSIFFRASSLFRSDKHFFCRENTMLKTVWQNCWPSRVYTPFMTRSPGMETIFSYCFQKYIFSNITKIFSNFFKDFFIWYWIFFWVCCICTAVFKVYTEKILKERSKNLSSLLLNPENLRKSKW